MRYFFSLFFIFFCFVSRKRRRGSKIFSIDHFYVAYYIISLLNIHHANIIRY